MKNLRLVTFLVFAVCTFSLQTMPQTQKTNTSQSAVPATSLNGKITNKDTGLTVLTVGVRAIPINVGINAKTTFSLNGVAANFEGIKVGDSVVVEYLPLSDQVVAAISVEAHRHRRGSVSDVLEPLPPPAGYKYCPYSAGSGIPASATPCYCNKCGGDGSGMVW